jgi:predicted TIM-barrel fold metal-dependent hydrolase
MNVIKEAMVSGGVSAAVVSVSPEVWYIVERDPSEIVELTRKINDWFASDELIGFTTPARFGAFAALPMPDVNATVAEIKRTLVLPGINGKVLDGVGMYTSYNGVRLSDPSFSPVWEELDALGAAVFIHPTYNFAVDPAPEIKYSAFEFPAETTRTLVLMWRNGVLDKYPNINFIAAHGAGLLAFDVSDVISDLTSGLDPATTPDSLRSIYADTSKVKAEPADGALKAMEAFVGYSHIFYGSDWPYGEPVGIYDNQPGVQAYAEVHWTSDQRNGVARDNALNLFPRLQAAIDADVLARSMSNHYGR